MMKLKMRESPAPAQDLPADDDVIETDYMGACVSVIVQWDKQGGSYQKMRGYHGGGGIEVVNFDSLLTGVPDLPSTQVYVISGADNKSVYARKVIRDTVKQEIMGRLPHVSLHTHHTISNATVDRAGKVSFISFLSL